MKSVFDYCEKCGNYSIIKVSEMDGTPIYSCITENCVFEAILLVYIGYYINIFDVFSLLERLIKDEKNNNTEGQG